MSVPVTMSIVNINKEIRMYQPSKQVSKLRKIPESAQFLCISMDRIAELTVFVEIFMDKCMLLVDLCYGPPLPENSDGLTTLCMQMALDRSQAKKLGKNPARPYASFSCLELWG